MTINILQNCLCKQPCCLKADHLNLFAQAVQEIATVNWQIMSCQIAYKYRMATQWLGAAESHVHQVFQLSSVSPLDFVGWSGPWLMLGHSGKASKHSY